MREGGIYAHATYRLVISLLLTAGYFIGVSSGNMAEGTPSTTFIPAVILAYAMASYGYAHRGVEQSSGFLKTTLLLDVVALSVLTVFYGSLGAVIFPLYLLLVFAYGMPNGEAYLQASSGLATLGFTVAYLLSPQWGEPALAVGLLASLFYLPLMWVKSLPSQRQESIPLGLSEPSPDVPATQEDALSELSQELKSQIKEVVTDSGKLLKQGLSPRKKNLTKAIANNSATALRLVREVDEYARLSSGQQAYTPELSSLLSIIRDVTEACGEEAEKKSLTYEVVFDPSLLSPALLCGKEVRQVLSHLIGNAVKYTERGYVRLKVAAREEAGKTFWRYEISDSGQGIEESQYDMVFEPFVRADAGRSHSSRGLGLGATVARLLVLGMKGEIGFHSEAHKGSTFWFEVPVTPQAAKDRDVEAPFSVASLSLNSRERETLAGLDAKAISRSSDISLDHVSALEIENTDLFLVGEYASEQELLGLTDLVPETSLPVRLVRYQRLQPDDMMIYSRRKFGDLVSIPASTGEAELAEIFRSLAEPQGFSDTKSSRVSKDKLSVLIADNTSASRDILATMLVNKGHQIYLARNSQQARDIVRSIALDLILLDPELADEGLCSSIDSRPPQACLLVSGKSTSQSSIKRLAAYSDGELKKPLQTREVYAAMDRLFSGLSTEASAEKRQPKAAPSHQNLLKLDHQTLNTMALEELEEVDNGNGLLQRFVDRYIEDSSKVFRKLRQACEMQDLSAVKTHAEEFESISSQLGLEKLEEFCKRIRTIEGRDLESKSANLVSRLETLHLQAHKALLEYRDNFERRS